VELLIYSPGLRDDASGYRPKQSPGHSAWASLARMTGAARPARGPNVNHNVGEWCLVSMQKGRGCAMAKPQPFRDRSGSSSARMTVAAQPPSCKGASPAMIIPWGRLSVRCPTLSLNEKGPSHSGRVMTGAKSAEQNGVASSAVPLCTNGHKAEPRPL
jgi:hypothetical protein